MVKHVLTTTDEDNFHLDDNQFSEVLFDLNKDEKFVKYEDNQGGYDITRYINVDSIKTIIKYK